MSLTVDMDYDEEIYGLVEEFVERDLLSPDATEQAQRLAAEGHTQAAVEVILADRGRL